MDAWSALLSRTQTWLRSIKRVLQHLPMSTPRQQQPAARAHGLRLTLDSSGGTHVSDAACSHFVEQNSYISPFQLGRRWQCMQRAGGGLCGGGGGLSTAAAALGCEPSPLELLASPGASGPITWMGKFNERFTCGGWLGEGSVELEAWLSGVRNAEGGVLDGLFDLGTNASGNERV